MTHRWLRVLKRPDDPVKERCRKCGLVRRRALGMTSVWKYCEVGHKAFLYTDSVPPCPAK